jgi:hypothetical protein
MTAPGATGCDAKIALPSGVLVVRDEDQERLDRVLSPLPADDFALPEHAVRRPSRAPRRLRVPHGGLRAWREVPAGGR